MRGIRHSISLCAALIAASFAVGAGADLPARILTPVDYFVGPITYDPFQYIHLDEEAGEILMLLSAVHDPLGESRAFFHRIRFSENGNSEPKLLSEPGRSATGAQLKMGPDGRLHAVWLKLVPKRENWISYSYSDNRGESWSEAQNFLAGFSPREPVLQLVGHSTVIVGVSSSEERPSTGERIYLWVSADQGETWKERNINSLDRKGSTSGLRIAVGPDRRVLAAWVDMSADGTRIVGNVSEDRGETWLDQPVPIGDDAQRRVADFRLHGDEQGFSVGWLAGGPRNYQLMFDRSNPTGTSWGEDRILAAPEVDRMEYDIVFHSDRIFCIWTESEGYGRFLRETLKVKAFAHPSLEEVFPETLVYDAGEAGQTMVGFDLSPADGGVSYVSAIAHSISRGWHVAVWQLDLERRQNALVWENQTGISLEVTTAALRATGDKVLLLTREGGARRLPQQSVFNGSLFLRTLEVGSTDEAIDVSK